MTRVNITDFGYVGLGGADIFDSVALVPAIGEEDEVGEAIYVPRARQRTVAAAITSPEKIYSAHRGGSVEYPEHSMRAFTQAVVEGFSFLEWSSQRTSDGVFVGCHNADINDVVFRSSAQGNLSTVYPAISAMTWAQISALKVKPPTQHPTRSPEPFMRFEELYDAYGHSHLFMFDPKNIASAFKQETIDFLASHGGPDKILTKWVGGDWWLMNNSGGILGTKARGYKHWAAVYSSDFVAADGAPASANAVCDIWGINYDASQAHFDALLATGKRVLAHLPETQAQANTGFAKGATGAQVAGTEAVNPYNF